MARRRAVWILHIIQSVLPLFMKEFTYLSLLKKLKESVDIMSMSIGRSILKAVESPFNGEYQSAKTLTLTLHGVQNSPKLFYRHLGSMHRRGGGSQVICLDYFDPREVRLERPLHVMAREIFKFIYNNSYEYDTFYLDGVSCGAKVFLHALDLLRCERSFCSEKKVVFNCINAVLQPWDIKTRDFNLAKRLPLGVDFAMTPMLRVAHNMGWHAEAKRYGMQDDDVIRALNEDANNNISWTLLKRQVEFMNEPLDVPYRSIRLKGLNVVMSDDDEVIDNNSVRDSAVDVFDSDECNFIEVPTKHSTLAYEPEVWGEYFYK
jgi:hypothetical protein